MDNIFILLIVALTSFVVYQVTKTNRNEKKLSEAIRAFFEWIGMFSLFFVVNLMIGVVVVFLIRTFTPRFVALYSLQNFLLLFLSAVQAFVFHHSWRRL